MQRNYEIPADEEGLDIGNWVEIFEAYGTAEGEEAIRVRSMRIGGKVIEFKKENGRGAQPLRPHEGQIVSIDRQPTRTRFGLRLRA